MTITRAALLALLLVGGHAEAQCLFDATGTISNNDTATVSIGNASVSEGTNLELIVTLSIPVEFDTEIILVL